MQRAPRMTGTTSLRTMRLAALTGVLLACMLCVQSCRQQPQGRIRFCESFTADDSPLGEDVSFSTGSVSMLLEFAAPMQADELRISAFRLSGSARAPYGDGVTLTVTPNFTRLRLDDAVSFADTGRYLVRISTRDAQPLAEGVLTIVGDDGSAGD